MGSLGNPWFINWQTVYDVRCRNPATLIFPPLEESVLLHVASRVANACVRKKLLVLVPRWPSKNFYPLLLRSATCFTHFKLRLSHACYYDSKLP